MTHAEIFQAPVVPDVSDSRCLRGNAPKTSVLVVDDERIIANTIATILNRSGFEARAVYSGEAAIEALSTFSPDVFLSDVMMPSMTGIEAAIAIRLRCPTCRVLLLSGQAGTVNLLQTARAQGHDFEMLAKPVHPLELLARLGASVVH